MTVHDSPCKPDRNCKPFLACLCLKILLSSWVFRWHCLGGWKTSLNVSTSEADRANITHLSYVWQVCPCLRMLLCEQVCSDSWKQNCVLRGNLSLCARKSKIKANKGIYISLKMYNKYLIIGWGCIENRKFYQKAPSTKNFSSLQPILKEYGLQRFHVCSKL